MSSRKKPHKKKKDRPLPKTQQHPEWCECEIPGTPLYTGHRGALALLQEGLVDARSTIWACELCHRYASGAEALAGLREAGLVPADRISADCPPEMAERQSQIVAEVRDNMWLNQELRRQPHLAVRFASLVSLQQAHAILLAQCNEFFHEHGWPAARRKLMLGSINFQASRGVSPERVAALLSTHVAKLVRPWRPKPRAPFQFDQESDHGEASHQSPQPEPDPGQQ